MKKSKLFLLTYIVLLLALASVGCNKRRDENKEGNMLILYTNAYKIYVDGNNGNDQNDGKQKDTAFKTIQKALTSAGELSVQELVEFDAVSIELLQGKYTLNQTLQITNPLTNDKKLVIEGENNNVYISGGQDFTGGWQVYDADKNIYKINLPDTDFRQLYVNNNAAVRARYPNYQNDHTIDTLGLKWDENAKRVGFDAYENNFLPEDIAGLELHFVQEWAQTIGIIESKQVVDNAVLFKLNAPVTEKVFTRQYPGRNNSMRGWVENSLSLLDDENEFYFDRQTKDLYYKPQANQSINSLTFTVPKIQTLISIEGTRESFVSNIAFKNIVFEYTNWTEPNIGYVDMQAGQHYAVNNNLKQAHPPAAVYTSFAKNIIFTQTVVRNVGAVGIDFHIGTKNVSFIGNKVIQTAGNGISIGHFNDSTPKTTNLSTTGGYIPESSLDIVENIVVNNCYITQIGKAYRGGTAIVGGFLRNITLSNNLIHDVSYSGIGLGWGWLSPSTFMGGFVIEYNKIYDCMNYLTFDGSELYLLGKHTTAESTPLSRISNNYVETKNGLGGIYFDEASSLYLVTNNVIKGIGIKGVINFHDINCAVENITITNTYGSATTVNFQTYWRDDTSRPLLPTTARNISVESIIKAYNNGKWSKEAIDIINAAGLESHYLFIKG